MNEIQKWWNDELEETEGLSMRIKVGTVDGIDIYHSEKVPEDEVWITDTNGIVHKVKNLNTDE